MYYLIKKFHHYLSTSLGVISVLICHSVSAADNYGIVGSWDASIDAFGSTSRALYSFHQGGTLTEADNPGFDPGFNGDALSPGLGAWQRTSPSTASATYQKLAYDETGQLTSVYISTMDVSLDNANTISGTVSITVTAPDGSVLSEIPALPFTADRIAAATSSSCVDTDGDGWGWDGSSSCRP